MPASSPRPARRGRPRPPAPDGRSPSGGPARRRLGFGLADRVTDRGGAGRPSRLAWRRPGLPPLRRTTWLEIDLDALASQPAPVRTLAPPGARLAAVVKADAYGHGLAVAARTLVAAGADGLCVATFDEALDLRVHRGRPADPRDLRGALRAVGEAMARASELGGGGRRAALAALLLPRRGRPGGVDGRPAAEARAAPGGRDRAGSGRLAAGRDRSGGGPHPRAPGARLAGVWTHLAQLAARPGRPTARQRRRFDEGVASVRASGRPSPPRAWAASGGLLGRRGGRQRHGARRARPLRACRRTLPGGAPRRRGGRGRCGPP